MLVYTLIDEYGRTIAASESKHILKKSLEFSYHKRTNEPVKEVDGTLVIDGDKFSLSTLNILQRPEHL